MNREIIPTNHFSKILKGLLKKRQLLQEDYDEFLEELAKNPESGDPIPGTGGVRKIRLKSASKGKRGGFRVFYFYIQIKGRIYLFHILAKNEQEDITEDEKKALRDFANHFKRGP
jgi:mRNA-degrading endonuclease RelE of RelBE toxin-antitoxin system